MFKIGPPGSSSGSELSSRSQSPSKESEWSTTSEPFVEPKTPEKPESSDEANWSDHSETPVRPRMRNKTGRVIPRRSTISSLDSTYYESDEWSELSLEEFSDFDSQISIGERKVKYTITVESTVVGPAPPIAIHSDFKHSREAWGLPPLALRCPDDSRRHPSHIYEWDTLKLNCYDDHEKDCTLCGASCCSVKAYNEALKADPHPNPMVPLKYRESFQRDIDEINTLKPRVTDPFTRMLTCDTCYRNVCPQCAGRCMKPSCLRVICKSCGDPNPWIHCQCEMIDGKVKISYL